MGLEFFIFFFKVGKEGEGLVQYIFVRFFVSITNVILFGVILKINTVIDFAQTSSIEQIYKNPQL